MKAFLDYDIKYPELILELIEYFTHNTGNKPTRTIGGFCEYFKTPEGEDILQPDIIGRICDRLCEMRKMVSLRKKGIMCYQDMYCAIPFDHELMEKHRETLAHMYNSYVYGFEYIYRHYKERTLPLIVTTTQGESMGSCFRIFDGIATAKHCLVDGETVAIRGYKKEHLQQCGVYVSKNHDIDLAFIATGENFIYNEGEPNVLENVMVMGYPRVPFFLEFCTAEKANISAMADLRITATLGSIAAEGEMYYPPNLPNMLLVTAKMKGGNSGGPVINEKGYVVGIATGIPAGEGISDDHVGYGIAYSIQALIDMINEDNKVEVEFMDFPY